MPRASLPNARFLATADSPLLPFLAPRLFADAPIPGRSRRRDGRTTQEVQETEKNDRGSRYDGTGPRESDSKDAGWTSGRRLKLALDRSVGGLLQASSPAMGSTNTLHSRTSLDLRYADIFSFARQQLRSYSAVMPTLDAQDGVHSVSAKAHRTIRRQRSPRQSDSLTINSSAQGGNIEIEGNIRMVAFAARNAARAKGRIRRVASGSGKIRRVPSAISGQARRVVPKLRATLTAKVTRADTLFHKRRTRAAHVAQKNLETFLSYAYRTNRTYRMKQGRYRSLERRVYTFTREEPSLVDMVQDRDRFKNHIQAFAALDRSIYGGLQRTSRPISIQHDPRCASWATALFKDLGSDYEEHLWKRWLDIDEETRETCWPYLLIYLLHRLPGEALLFLRLLNRETAVKSRRPELVADALEHLAKLHASKLYIGDSWGTKREWNRAVFVPTFYQIFRPQFSLHPGICSQDLLLSIAKLATIDDLKRVFDLLQESNANMLYVTLLHYANTFAKAGEHEYALLCLKRIATKSTSIAQRHKLVNRTNFRWTCALIIRKSTVKGEQYHETTGIVAALVELGVELDTLLYNAIISNAMEAGDYKTAFALYNNLGENGLEPNKRTFSILLHGCTMMDDPGKFDGFAEHCAKVAKELRDPWLATDYLYYLYVRHSREDEQHRSQDFTVLSRAYLEFFSVTAIEPLWNMAQLQQTPADPGASAVEFAPMAPPPLALYIMLQAGVRNTVKSSNSHVWNLFLMFTHLVQAKYHPTLNKLAREPVIWNAFLLAFCQAQQFDSASRLIKHMTENSPQPNIYSWNIFMQGFFKTGQVEAAERVFEIMRKRGVEPDQFSHGTLLRGYVKVQNFARVGAAMEHVDAKQQMDPDLLQALARVHDRANIISNMEAAWSRKLQKEEEKARKLSAQEAERWAPPPAFSLLLRRGISHHSENVGRDEDKSSEKTDEMMDFVGDSQTRSTSFVKIRKHTTKKGPRRGV